MMFIVVAWLALMAVGTPIALIWALNTLFGLGIAYTFSTWLASLVIISLFGKVSVQSNKGAK